MKDIKLLVNEAFNALSKSLTDYDNYISYIEENYGVDTALEVTERVEEDYISWVGM